MRLTPLITIVLFVLTQGVVAQNELPPIRLEGALIDFGAVSDSTAIDSAGVPAVFSYGSPSLQEYIVMMDSMDAKQMKSMGYRIQLFSISGPNAKRAALEKQAEVLQLYGDIPSYTKWNYPNWVVRVGDFRTRLGAMEMHAELKEKFPASFITKDEINLKYDK